MLLSPIEFQMFQSFAVFSCQKIHGLKDNLQESPIFDGKLRGFQLRFSQLNQSIDETDA